MSKLLNLALFVAWIAGVVIAQGGWAILAALIPLYAWYVVVQKLFQMWGVV